MTAMAPHMWLMLVAVLLSLAILAAQLGFEKARKWKELEEHG